MCAMFFVLVFSSLLTVTSCSKDDKEEEKPALIGWWHRYEKNQEYKLTFYDGGIGLFNYPNGSSEGFRYYISGSSIYGKYDGVREELDWSYRIDNRTLFLLDNKDPLGHYVAWERLQ